MTLNEMKFVSGFVKSFEQTNEISKKSNKKPVIFDETLMEDN